MKEENTETLFMTICECQKTVEDFRVLRKIIKPVKVEDEVGIETRSFRFIWDSQLTPKAGLPELSSGS